MRWSIEEYKEKVRKRRIRQLEREREREEAIAKGNASLPKATGDASKDKKRGVVEEQVESEEDEDSQDELYIDQATKRNHGVSTHIMYVRALCHREVQNYKVALESYARVMKRENELSDYEKMIEQENFKNLSLKSVEGPGFPGWKIDLYSHFSRLKLLQPNNPLMMINLREYYTWKEGWSHDRVPDIIKDLQLIRFFNRFDRETLYQMMKKTDLRVIKKHNLLFLEKD